MSVIDDRGGNSQLSRAGQAGDRQETMEFLDEVGLVGGPSTLLLRRAHII